MKKTRPLGRVINLVKKPITRKRIPEPANPGMRIFFMYSFGFRSAFTKMLIFSSLGIGITSDPEAQSLDTPLVEGLNLPVHIPVIEYLELNHPLKDPSPEEELIVYRLGILVPSYLGYLILEYVGVVHTPEYVPVVYRIPLEDVPGCNSSEFLVVTFYLDYCDNPSQELTLNVNRLLEQCDVKVIYEGYRNVYR
ncbi:193aa long hypothetical protein [Pyrococcus horikoshii OT3]|uniref:Uncharacterized protein n=1 Tax=Pyrococcus horikoshii (strain ATCC 700860 / DSM 12428 / JCM 9974 / NBRC 100139 / OT-3) TaxID=70601 RepID=O58293_PYRHO|nr:193aa long hypothetical protein [Pyrococcus horikoshii OT3]